MPFSTFSPLLCFILCPKQINFSTANFIIWSFAKVTWSCLQLKYRIDSRNLNTLHDLLGCFLNATNSQQPGTTSWLTIWPTEIQHCTYPPRQWTGIVLHLLTHIQRRRQLRHLMVTERRAERIKLRSMTKILSQFLSKSFRTKSSARRWHLTFVIERLYDRQFTNIKMGYIPKK